MSTFVIFAIVLTLGYILYYAAMITIDMTARKKSDAATEETINTDGFSDAEPVDIAEANEEEPLSTTTGDEGETTIDEATDEDGTEGADVPDDAPDVPGDDEQAVAEEPLEDGVSAEETSELEDEEEPVPGIEYFEEKPEDDADKKDFDVNDVFDPDLLTPKYGVTELVEPPVSDEAQEKANMVNASLLSIASKGNQMDSFDLTRVIREQRAGQLNIETHDEVTNY